MHLHETVFLQKPRIDSRSEDGLRPEQFIGNIEFEGVDFIYESRPELKVLHTSSTLKYSMYYVRAKQLVCKIVCK